MYRNACPYIKEARYLKFNSEWCQVSINIRQQDHSETGSMYCIIKCIVQGKQAQVKNADLPHPSCTVVMSKRKSASPVLNVLSSNESFKTSLSIIVQRDATIYSLLYFCKPLYMFRVVPSPIIRSTHNCNYTLWHWSTVSATFRYRVWVVYSRISLDNYWHWFAMHGPMNIKF